MRTAGLCESNVSGCPLRPVLYENVMISSPSDSPVIWASGKVRLVEKFARGHPERGRFVRLGWGFERGIFAIFRPISRLISETVQDTTKVTIEH